MAIVPETTSDTAIHRLIDDGEYPRTNPETLANGRVNELREEKIAKLFEGEYKALEATAAAMDRVAALIPKVHEIDLRGRNLDIRYEFHGTYLGKQQWTAWDARSYDGEESSLGHGESKEDALIDLMDRLGPVAAETPRASRVIHTSAFEPPEFADERRDTTDDDVTFDDGFPGDVRE